MSKYKRQPPCELHFILLQIIIDPHTRPTVGKQCWILVGNGVYFKQIGIAINVEPSMLFVCISVKFSYYKNVKGTNHKKY